MTQAATSTVKQSTVTVTFNGADQKITYNPSASMQALLAHAKQAFGVQSNHLLSLFTEDGTELPDGVSAAEAGIASAALLILRQSTVRGGGS
jgi:predicted glycosyl hydrolase (DUF1957 family)